MMYKGVCKLGQNWKAERNGSLLLMPDDFECRKAFINPQYHVYVCCKEKTFEEGKDCFCEAFKDVRKKEASKKRISPYRLAILLEDMTIESRVAVN